MALMLELAVSFPGFSLMHPGGEANPARHQIGMHLSLIGCLCLIGLTKSACFGRREAHRRRRDDNQVPAMPTSGAGLCWMYVCGHALLPAYISSIHSL